MFIRYLFVKYCKIQRTGFVELKVLLEENLLRTHFNKFVE